MSDEHETNTPGTVFERMSAIADRAKVEQAGDKPSAIDAARAHLGTDEPRGSVEDAMISGADLETGELPARDLAEERMDAYQFGTVAGVPKGSYTLPTPAESSKAEIVDPAPEPLKIAAPESPKTEIVEPERAADGLPAPFAARDTGSLINLLEGGQFSADVIAAMTALATGMTEIAQATGKRQKGVLTIKVNLQTDDTGEAFFVQGDFAVRAPKVERRKTLLWPDDKGHMSPSQPRQKVFFGVRDAGGGPRQIRDATAERRPL